MSNVNFRKDRIEKSVIFSDSESDLLLKMTVNGIQKILNECVENNGNLLQQSIPKTTNYLSRKLVSV